MSPLTKRLPRELAHNLSKYLGIFFLIGFTIAMISGYLAAARSIQRIVADARAASNPQDFSFTTQFRASDEALRDVRDSQEGTEVAEDFYADVPLTFAGKADGTNVTVRLYKNRTDIDTASYVAGRAPDTDDEIALDRIFMTNNGLSLGDTVTVSGHDLTIVGQCVLPDYEALVRKNSDLMFDVLDFSVAQVTPGGYDLLAGDATTYHYSARFADRTLGLASRTTREEDVSRLLTDDGQIVTELLDRESTSSITFADEDLAHDQVGYQVMLFLLIMISGFIFVVLTDATIEQESAIIGTLLATGYRTRELVRHYLILPRRPTSACLRSLACSPPSWATPSAMACASATWRVSIIAATASRRSTPTLTCPPSSRPRSSPSRSSSSSPGWASGASWVPRPSRSCVTR